MPIFLREYGPSVAFGIPGLLMAVATVIFWAGRNKYVHVPPATSNPHSFLRVVRTALFAQGSGRMGLVVAGLGSVLALVALASLHEIGRAHVWTPGTNVPLVGRRALEQKDKQRIEHVEHI